MPLFLRATYSTAILMIVIGTLGVCLALGKFLSSDSSGLPVMAAGLALSIAVVAAGLGIRSVRWFLTFVIGCWLLSRGSIVALFPNFVLSGDERYFHQFVASLAGVFSAGHIADLSGIYDFPVWLSRAFPFYLPLAALFGANDLWAARILNLLLGAGQVLFVFLIARRLLGHRAARLCCLLLLIFPYHCLNVLSYDPQIAGTFFLLLAVWLFLRLVTKPTAVTAAAVCLALSLLLAGIQRGGIDILLVGVIPLALWLHRIPRRQALTCLAALCFLWLPARLGFDQWIAQQDSHTLRSHALGFMTRGWNLDTAGEYLPLYEQLDIVSPRAEKQRTLEAVLITEFARQPVRSLLVLTPLKIAKFFAVGYASTAEQGLRAGGYPRAPFLYQCLSSAYAACLLVLCALGLLRCWRNIRLQRRLLVPVLLLVLSCLAIVLVWETSPRYSHPIQFTLLILATVGIAGFPKAAAALRLQPRLVFSLAGSGIAVVSCWLVVSVCIVGVARSATRYQFLDPRAISAHLNRGAVEVEPLHSFSRSWEGAIRLPAGTALPATVTVAFPPPRAPDWDHLSVSVWLPDTPSAAYEVSCGSVSVPPAASGRISRVSVPNLPKQATQLTLHILSHAGVGRISSGFRVGIGYALPN